MRKPVRASTTLTLTAVGTIPATAHSFDKAGTFTVIETIIDVVGNKSNIATFTDVVIAPFGSINTRKSLSNPRDQGEINKHHRLLAASASPPRGGWRSKRWSRGGCSPPWW